MNKKLSHLYITLFLVSMFFTASIISVFASDTQQTSTITYDVPSASERNTYEINIPSNIDIAYGETEKQVAIQINDGYNLESDYVVHVDIAKSTFNDDGDIHSKVKLFNTTDNSYYHTLKLMDANGSLLFYESTSSRESRNVATFHADSSNNTGGIVSLNYSASDSNDSSYHDSATYSGTITFNIYGNYE